MSKRASHTKNVSLQIFLVYRPPPSASNILSFAIFREEFSEIIILITSKHKYYVILGDFNIHVDNKSWQQTHSFTDVLGTVNLSQFVPKPTHTAGHILDLVLFC